MRFRYSVLILTILACLMVAGGIRAQYVVTRSVKCANPEFGRALSQNSKGVTPLQWLLPTGFQDSILSASGRFMIYYDSSASNPDSDAAPDYARHAAEEADSAYAFEMGALGYTPPAFTEGSHYNLYIAPLHSSLAAYGGTYILEGGQLGNSPSGNERWRSYFVIDNAFTSPIYATHGFDAERITIFHEFFHVTQFSGYGRPPAYQDPFPNYVYFQEMSSVWMEWLSTPNVKDYLNYVASYLSTLNDRFDKSPSEGYGQYIFFAYLTHRFDTSIVKKIWEYYRDSSSDPVTCIDEVLRRDYGTSFCEEYERFGSEVIQTGRRYKGESLLPDAQALAVDTIPVVRLLVDSVWRTQTFALSLQFACAGDGSDSCFAILARDTNRALESNASVEYTALGAPPIITLDSAPAYCDTEVCLTPMFVTSPNVQVFPNPFISDGSSEAYILASTNPLPPISVVMNIMNANEDEIRSTKGPAVPFKDTWNATWDGRDDAGKLVPSGEYLYALHVDGALKAGKIVVVRK